MESEINEEHSRTSCKSNGRCSFEYNPIIASVNSLAHGNQECKLLTFQPSTLNHEILVSVNKENFSKREKICRLTNQNNNILHGRDISIDQE